MLYLPENVRYSVSINAVFPGPTGLSQDKAATQIRNKDNGMVGTTRATGRKTEAGHLAAFFSAREEREDKLRPRRVLGDMLYISTVPRFLVSIDSTPSSVQ